MDWKPMESAPRDGSKFLAWNVCRGHPQAVRWCYRGITSTLGNDTGLLYSFYSEDAGDQQGFTHWAPMPESPCPDWKGFAPGPVEERRKR